MLAAETDADRRSAQRVEFQVLDLRSGRDYVFAAEIVGAAVLVSKDLLPDIEVWSPAGPQQYARCVFRKVGQRYCCTRQDTFETNTRSASSTALTLPGSTQTMLHVGSRANVCE